MHLSYNVRVGLRIPSQDFADKIGGDALVYHPTISGLREVWLDRADSTDHE